MDFRVFGKSDGKLPAPVKKLSVSRDKKDSRNALIKWDKVADAYGYNISFGKEKNKLYNCITVYDNTTYDFRGMDKGAVYYFAIEALGESGVSPRSSVLAVK